MGTARDLGFHAVLDLKQSETERISMSKEATRKYDS
jgi:hypothetical protein